MAEPGDASSLAAAAMTPSGQQGKPRGWIWKLRTNSRFAFLLQITARIITAALNLLWSRLQTEAMGKALYGLFSGFQDVFSLGGLGDLGMGGAIGIRTGQYLSQGKEKEPELLRFLASARTVFIVLTVLCSAGVLILSPWIPHWKNFSDVPGEGPVVNLFEVGALLVAGMMLFSYISNVNYACGNVAWPVLPDFLLLQASLASQWLLARQAQPLWIQFLPYLVASFLKLWLMWLYVRTSHRPLSRLSPLSFDWPLAVNLFEGSFWIYLCCLGNAIYRKTDNLVIISGFPPGTNTEYNFNYKACDLMYMVVTTASFVILPKITQWMASPDAKDRARVLVEMRRLNQFQILLGCAASLGYLAFNTIFIKIWWYKTGNLIQPAALGLQIAFALNMAVTASGDTTLQLALRSGHQGLRVAGTLVGVTGVLNLCLSIIAMRMQWLPGIALATVVAQSALMLGSSYYLCRHLKIAWLPWALKGCVLPLLGISFAGWLRLLWPMDSVPHVVLLLGSYLILFMLAAWGLGVNRTLIKEELQIVRKLFGKK